jgi:hypothetical protein
VTAGRVIVLSRDRGLASVGGELLDHGQALTRFVSPAELPDWLSQPVAAVVLDFPRRARGIVYRQLRQRYQGPVLALLEPGETSSGLPTDRGRLEVLQRPFRGEQLSSTLATLAGWKRGRASRVSGPALSATPVGAEPALAGRSDIGGVAAFSPTTPVSGPGPRARGEAIAASIGATLALPPPPPVPTTGNALVGAGLAATAPRSRARRRRGAARLQLGVVGRHRLKAMAVTLCASGALLVGITLSGEPGCRAAGCGIASAIGTGGVPPAVPPGISASPSARPSGSGAGRPPANGAPAQTPAAPGPAVTIPIASGVGDLLSGTSSSSGGAPLLVVGGSQPPAPGGGSTPPAGGGSGGGTPPATTRPPGTTAPPTTAPPTTAPPATAPPTTAPPATAPPTTAPPVTEPPTTTTPPTTEPPTTEPPTTTPPTTEPPTTSEPPPPTT